jgi:hypothetical protein
MQNGDVAIGTRLTIRDVRASVATGWVGREAV